MSPLRRRICVICSALLHDARIGFSFVTPPMDGPRHLQLQCPANRPSGAPRPDPEPDFANFTSRRRSSGREGNNASLCGDGCLSNDVITPLTEYDQRASPSVLPVPAPRATVELRARERDPQHRRRLRHPRSRARARTWHHKRTRGRSARSSRGYPATRSPRSRHCRRPICAIHALHRACAVAVCGHTNRC
jgi:hypothetical protein